LVPSGLVTMFDIIGWEPYLSSRRQQSATLGSTLDPFDSCSSGWEGGRCGRENRGPHAFKEHGLAAVWIDRDVGGSRGSLILTAIRRRVLVGLNQLLVRPVVVGHARVCSTAPAVATRERAQRQPQISQRGSPSPPTMNLILSISSVDGRYKATLITRRSGASPGAAANGPAKSQRFGLSSALALPTVTSRTRTWA
jgi:hypothetical protein